MCVFSKKPNFFACFAIFLNFFWGWHALKTLELKSSTTFSILFKWINKMMISRDKILWSRRHFGIEFGCPNLNPSFQSIWFSPIWKIFFLFKIKLKLFCWRTWIIDFYLYENFLFTDVYVILFKISVLIKLKNKKSIMSWSTIIVQFLLLYIVYIRLWNMNCTRA